MWRRNIYGALRQRGVATAAGSLDSYLSGLWCACGITQIVGGYTGPAIRVRRNSDNAEEDIYLTGSGVLDTAALAAFAGSIDTHVKTFYDQTGQGNHFSHATTTRQPRISAGGVYDGFLRFDGGNDCLQSVNASGTPSTMSAFIKGALRVSNVTQIILEQNAVFPAAAKNLFLYYSTGSIGDGKTNLAWSEGAGNYVENFYLPFLADNVHGAVIDRSQTTASLEARLYVSGTGEVAYVSTTPTGSNPTGNFTAETWNFGARNGGASLPTSLNAYSLVIYEANKNSDAAAICNALA